MPKSTKSGFTLLELLIVVGIIATLSTVSIIVLNPSEAIAKSRDAQRISDLTTLKKAIGIYMVSTPNPKLAGTDNTGCKGTAFGSTWQLDSDHIYYSLPTESGTITGKALDGVTFTTGGASQVSKANLGKVDGNGWLPINFTAMSGGSPISALPVDPVNKIADLANPKSTDLVYRYICTEKDLTYEIHATLESTAYTVTDNKMAKDGGTSNNYYEVGTSLALLGTESVGGGGLYSLRDTGPGGGLVFYITDGGLHGFEAAPTDQSTGIEWAINDYISTSVPGTSTAIGAGSANTNLIIAQNSAGTTYAAGVARAYTNNGKSDWFLPSKDELSKMYLNLKSGTDENSVVYTPVGGLGTGDRYWSSSQSSDYPDYVNATSVWVKNFTNGYTGDSGKGYHYGYVRAVRAF